MGSVDIVLPSRDSARIANPFRLTLQIYELFHSPQVFFQIFSMKMLRNQKIVVSLRLKNLTMDGPNEREVLCNLVRFFVSAPQFYSRYIGCVSSRLELQW